MTDNLNQFIHLRVHSAYSLAEGAIHVKKLVSHCSDNKIPAVAITDSNNMFGAMEFAIQASSSGVQPIIGTQILVSPEDHPVSNPSKMVLLAQNEHGYRNLCMLMSLAYMDTENQYEPQVTLNQLFENSDHIICLSGGRDGLIIPLLFENQYEKSRLLLEEFKRVFKDRFYIEIQRHGWVEEVKTEEDLLKLAYDLEIPIVATNDCFFMKKEMHEAHDALLCIAGGRYVVETDRRTVTPEHYFKSPQEMTSLFEDLPEAILNTVQIAKRCSWFVKPIDPILPPFDCGDGRSEAEELAHQSREGLIWRLENYVFNEFEGNEQERAEKEKVYFDRLDFELGIITQMGFPGYFLIVSDFIQWAKDHDIPVGPGRGSGAASIVAWALKITDLDPIALDLLFERFLNPERVSMPDFDIDFCQSRRDEVIKYVQQKYGFDHVAQIITFGKLQARAVVRDVGRVLQLSYGQVDKIAKLIPANPANPISLSEALETEPDLRAQRDSDPTVSKLINIALQLEGLYRHASTHAAGVVIGDRPLHDLIPVYRDPRSPMPVTQFNMKYIEQAGLVKFDFLGLKTLTVLQTAVNIVDQEYDRKIDLLAIPVDDKPTFEMLGRGDNTGVFQLESAGMRDVGRQMRLEQLEEIIALVALYRPGPMDNIPQYITNKFSDDERDYMHELLQPILEETFGIMIYQEQVMQAAQILAGYSLGGADLLRRAMGKKIKEEMDKQRELFMTGAAKNHNVPNEQSSHIFDQIAKFAGYGFNKAHAACYAFIAYQTAYMKANYPVEFFTASMTLDAGNTDKLNIFSQELSRLKIPLLPPCINKSERDFSVEHLPDGQKAVRYALAAVKGVGEQAMDSLVAERRENGLFTDVFDFSRRLDMKVMNKRQLENLTKAGAFDCLNPNRAAMMESIETLTSYASSISQEKASGQSSLFGDVGAGVSEEHLPKLSQRLEWDILERLQHEFDSVGFYLSAHPLDSEQDKLKKKGVISYVDLLDPEQNHKGRVKLAGVILKKQERISAKGNRFAFIQLSDTTGVYEPIVFSDTLASNRDLLSAGQTVVVNLEVQYQEGEEAPRLAIQSVESLDKALENLTKKVEIRIDDVSSVNSLKQILKTDEAETGFIDVTLFYNVPSFSAEAIIKFNKRLNLSPVDLRTIKAISGVKEVKEL